jgi:hypothetical protein
MDIDRARELADNEAINQTSPEPEAEAQCAVCGLQMVMCRDQWLRSDSVETHTDEDGDYLDGESLPEADDSKLGFFCSERCASDLTYRKADPLDRKALDAVLDACRVLAEHGERVAGILLESPLSGGFLIEGLTGQVNEFLDAVHYSDIPKWTDRESREDRLEKALRGAANKVETVVGGDLAVHIRVRIDNPKIWNDPGEWMQYIGPGAVLSKTSFSLAHIALDLRDALKEGE